MEGLAPVVNVFVHMGTSKTGFPSATPSVKPYCNAQPFRPLRNAPHPEMAP
jgi:hypothetical protein